MRARIRVIGAAAICLIAVGGCAVPVSQQGLVSKPNMVAADGLVLVEDSQLLGQTEPGTGAGGGAAGGCTSCK